MKKAFYFRPLLISILLCLLALTAEKAAAQENTLCFDLQFLPTKKIKKPKDTTCLLIENGFMYNKAEEIVKLSGLPMNFVVCKTNNIQNAFAALDKNGNRFIRYDDVFMKRLNTDSSAMESMIMLAHEIGHHIFFHTVLSGTNTMALNYQQYGVSGTATYDPQKLKQAEEEYYETRRRQELEADRFAGFIMARKGISIEQVTGFYKKLDKYYAGKNEVTHPSIDKRIDALKEGYAEVAAAKNKPINLSKLGKDKVEYVFNNTNKLERNRLLKKIQQDIATALWSINEKNDNLRYIVMAQGIFGFGPKIQTAVSAYLNRDLKTYSTVTVDDENDFFETYLIQYFVPDLNEKPGSYCYAYHIKAGYFHVVLFDPATEEFKIAYKSRFAADQISIEELKLLFTRTLKAEGQKHLNSVSQ